MANFSTINLLSPHPDMNKLNILVNRVAACIWLYYDAYLNSSRDDPQEA